MDHMPILAVLFQGIPESIIVYCFGIVMAGETNYVIKFKDCLYEAYVTRERALQLGLIS